MAGKALTRLGDNSVGEKPFPPRPAIEGSSTIFVNGKPAVRVGDHWLIHFAGLTGHDAVSRTGAPTVFFEGKAVVRVGDILSDKDIVAQGSPNVFVGDFGTPTQPQHRTWAQMTMQWKDANFPWKDA